MQKKILLTSFDIWLSQQESNSSDDLLLGLAKMASLSHDLEFLHRLPVDVQLASSLVIAKINELQPDYIICCGMAASRSQLSVEVLASSTSTLPVESTNSADILPQESRNSPENIFQTSVDLEKLLVGTAAVEISYDCGKFVCEGLYYSVLDYLHRSQLSVKCIFVHVPILNPENSLKIIADFVLIMNNLALL
ncbi:MULTISPECIES: pyroglutamyl peptidase [Nostocales]|jgi:pyroglutamyl-peptidase|uniref:pyroglutamyl-peptidase I family protein n=1 Tax=Nostocales TaxID=1161 RepID=UPI00029B6E93|nr:MULTISPECIES: pyroglutamyl peptidase [Nostocales]AFW93587.1 pyroglutamyl peptidase [Anabaena sp. 90]MTJ16093.1 peptidase C15 [Dolichospermum sp. UHCC 0299]MTJ20159.1 peptidase C15 [Dolichospermum sp. UHCC 0352]MTJ40005.1 peptidase C15 [Dolichospermum sp. UHCC 0406]